jgi:hypothetical protein
MVDALLLVILALLVSALLASAKSWQLESIREVSKVTLKYFDTKKPFIAS